MPILKISKKYKPLIVRALNLFQEFNDLVEAWGKNVSLQEALEDSAKLKSYRIARANERNFLDLYEMIKEIQDIIQSRYLPLINNTQSTDQSQQLLEVCNEIWEKYFIIAYAIDYSTISLHHFDTSDNKFLAIERV